LREQFNVVILANMARSQYVMYVNACVKLQVQGLFSLYTSLSVELHAVEHFDLCVLWRNVDVYAARTSFDAQDTALTFDRGVQQARQWVIFTISFTASAAAY
jgi:hypothetical protein